jgi:hypothetical protein
MNIYGHAVINTPLSLYFQPSLACLALLLGYCTPNRKQSGRDNDHSSSRIASGDSASLVRVSSVSGGVRTRPTDPVLANSFTSAVATLACMRPSSASLRVKCAISESYCSHSGIFRARSSFGSFCKHRFSGLCKSEPLIQASTNRQRILAEVNGLGPV